MNGSATASNDRPRDTTRWRDTGDVTEDPLAAPKSRGELTKLSRSIDPISLTFGDIVRHAGGHASLQTICGAAGRAMGAKALRTVCQRI